MPRRFLLCLYLSLLLPAIATPGEWTYFSFDSSPTTWVGRGYTDYLITPQTGWSFEASRNQVNESNAENSIAFYLSNLLPHDPTDLQPARNWQFRIAAPFKAVLTPGLYPGATRFPFQHDDKPGLDLNGTNRGNDSLIGSFEVLQAEYAPDGTIERFAVDFTIYEKSDNTRWITGEMRYRSTVPEPTTGTIGLIGLCVACVRRRSSR